MSVTRKKGTHFCCDQTPKEIVEPHGAIDRERKYILRAVESFVFVRHKVMHLAVMFGNLRADEVRCGMRMFVNLPAWSPVAESSGTERGAIDWQRSGGMQLVPRCTMIPMASKKASPIVSP